MVRSIRVKRVRVRWWVRARQGNVFILDSLDPKQRI